jgi:hypothetical protein
MEVTYRNRKYDYISFEEWLKLKNTDDYKKYLLEQPAIERIKWY